MNLKNLTVAALALGAMAGPALSADLPARMYTKAVAPVAYLPWSKCYVGVTAGYNRQETSPTLRTTDPNLLASITAGNVATRPGVDPDGAAVGGTIGCNKQYDRTVLGLEADLSYLSARSRYLSIQGPAVVTNTGAQQTDAIGTLRGRLGYAFDNTLLYATGGLAYGHLKNSFSIVTVGNPAAPALAATEDSWKVGWTVGAGVEHMFSPNWSVKAEYLYYDLGNSSVYYPTVSGAPFESGFMDYKNTGHIVRAGLNYHFTSPF